MSDEGATLRSIYRYPIKGLSPEALSRTLLSPGETIAGDRRFAIENGPSGFHPVHNPYLPKIHFLMLMRNERLATLRTHLDEETSILTIVTGGREAARGDLQSVEGRTAIEAFLADYCADELRGPPRILHADGHSFSDVPRKVVSIINLASVASLETLVGAPVDPLRFRANLYVDGWPAWHEFDLVEREVGIGRKARLRVVKRIERCAATNVDPLTGIRDLALPQTLMQAFGHIDCGIYAEVVAGGEIAVGDRIG
jgi:uncharacterized protein YcbX